VLIAVGDDAEVRDRLGPATRVRDGRGCCALHGLVDSHVHPFYGDVCRALEARGDLTVRLVMPMHQPPTISDSEVEERLGLAGERGRRWRAGTAEFFAATVVDGEIVFAA
jgi:predicted amidohydrolase YtcJ